MVTTPTALVACIEKRSLVLRRDYIVRTPIPGWLAFMPMSALHVPISASRNDVSKLFASSFLDALSTHTGRMNAAARSR